MIKVNVLPLVHYPKELAPLVAVDYAKELHEKLREYSYRIGNKLYIFGNGIKDFDSSKYKEIAFSENEEEQAVFSLLLRRLILYSIADAIETYNFFIPDNIKSTRRLVIQKKEPSLETDSVQVYESLELQTIHWQDKNFGIIVNYKTLNEWSPNFKKNVGEEPCSYENIGKHLPAKDANELLRDKIPRLIRRERQFGKWRGDALKQRFGKITELFKESVNWSKGEDVKEFKLPTEGIVKIADEFVEVVPLGWGEEYEILF